MKEYLSPELQITEFEAEDIVTVSDGDGVPGPEDNFGA